MIIAFHRCLSVKREMSARCSGRGGGGDGDGGGGEGGGGGGLLQLAPCQRVSRSAGSLRRAGGEPPLNYHSGLRAAAVLALLSSPPRPFLLRDIPRLPLISISCAAVSPARVACHSLPLYGQLVDLAMVF